MNFTYLFNGALHSDVSLEYMEQLGMNPEQIKSVLAQRDFELSQNIEKRKAAYREESDPLYMEWQYDVTAESEQAWRDKVGQIKQRYPIAEAE
ncbi:hypothetical protein KO533_16355 [Shewanella sp. NKUCC05_KAH]|uniref:hypothetical protein n=1 Tax=Shewanella sp. NKUCC05_KAH TaxID=2842126 RepID=UPI001C5BD0DE|nr:hypothetical protein [Shewanella sp. NKUCC05_KAH]MBW3528121.1 hypothetical protein [Shewanella sp. NKUCC05_KAH]